ncbi:putative membrane-anchored protein [Oxalobacteraceae bacterium GrIS 1.11]
MPKLAATAIPIRYSNLNHALRIPLAAEVHSRPFLRLNAPESVSHLAVYCRDGAEPRGANLEGRHAMLAALCLHFGVAAPHAEAKYFYHDFGRFRLKWECHTEFATYTFAEPHEAGIALADAFARVPLTHIPQDWLATLEGKIMVAAHVVLDKSGADVAQELPHVLEGCLLVGSQVLQGGEVWTDFLIQSDGFSRFVVRDAGLRELQAGSLVQRLLEIETYRMMALLGLPYAQSAVPELNAVEEELATLTATMVDIDATSDAIFPQRSASDPDPEQALLGSITRLAARVEKLSLDNNYRFSASQAYFRLVHARIEELRESRIEGIPTVGEFMERRLTPAMNTCAAIASRQEALAARIAHTNDLLRTRVGIIQEHQNRRILQSMDKRAAQQLRLQQAVEGLSVVAISYYSVGLLSYAGKALKAAGLPINVEVATGMLVPLVAGLVWLGLRRMHRRMHVE